MKCILTHDSFFSLKQICRHLHAILVFSVQQLLVGLGPTSISLLADGRRKEVFVY